MVSYVVLEFLFDEASLLLRNSSTCKADFRECALQ